MRRCGIFLGRDCVDLKKVLCAKEKEREREIERGERKETAVVQRRKNSHVFLQSDHCLVGSLSK